MKRVARFLIRAIIVISALLCAASVTFAFRGRTRTEQWVAPGPHIWVIRSAHGAAEFLRIENPSGEINAAAGFTSCAPADCLLLAARLDSTADPASERRGFMGVKVTSERMRVGLDRTTGAPLSIRQIMHRITHEFGEVFSGPLSITWVTIPLPLLAIITGAPPLVSLIRLVHRRLRAHRCRRAGHCSKCGYDCRATPARCPECGAMVACAEVIDAARVAGLAKPCVRGNVLR